MTHPEPAPEDRALLQKDCSAGAQADHLGRL
jgi:hypothetical protein